MPGKGKKVLARPITDFLETEDGSAEQVASPDSEYTASLQAMQQVVGNEVAKLTQDVGKIETKFKTFRQEICVSLANFEQKFDLKLATISHKRDIVGNAQQD